MSGIVIYYLFYLMLISVLVMCMCDGRGGLISMSVDHTCFTYENNTINILYIKSHILNLSSNLYYSILIA